MTSRFFRGICSTTAVSILALRFSAHTHAENPGPAQIEIESRIIEIDQGQLKKLSFNWLSVSPGTPSAFNTPATNTEPFAPGSLQLAGVLTPSQVQTFIRKVESKGGDVLSAPTLTIRDGQKAAFNSNGVHLVVTPRVSSDRDIIELDLSPQVSNFSYFRAHEISGDVYYRQEFGNAQQRVDRVQTDETTELVPKERFVDIRGIPGLTPILVDEEVQRRETTVTSKDVGPFGSHAEGAGLGINYFPTLNFGIGVDGCWVSGDHSDAYTVIINAIARFPIENQLHIAPFLSVGVGEQFADTGRAVGAVGGGIEKRFTPNFGIFFDARYTFDGDSENVAELRSGFRFAFGSQSESNATPIHVTLHHGQTAVVQAEPKKPLLDEMPVLRHLFKQPRVEARPLLILVKPVIINLRESED